MSFRPLASTALQVLGAAVLTALAAPSPAEPVFVNALVVPGSTLDAGGGTSVNDGRLGFFSDLYHDASCDEWWALSDRGPGGGTLQYETRVQ